MHARRIHTLYASISPDTVVSFDEKQSIRNFAMSTEAMRKYRFINNLARMQRWGLIHLRGVSRSELGKAIAWIKAPESMPSYPVAGSPSTTKLVSSSGTAFESASSDVLFSKVKGVYAALPGGFTVIFGQALPLFAAAISLAAAFYEIYLVYTVTQYCYMFEDYLMSYSPSGWISSIPAMNNCSSIVQTYYDGANGAVHSTDYTGRSCLSMCYAQNGVQDFGTCQDQFQWAQCLSALQGSYDISFTKDARSYTDQTYCPAFACSGDGYSVPTISNKVSVFAGTYDGDYADGVGEDASFYYPQGIRFNTSGALFVAEPYLGLIRKITLDGTVSTYSGIVGEASYINGAASVATYSYPYGVGFDASGNLLVADTGNCVIRKVNSQGVVSTLAGNTNCGYSNGATTKASFLYPYDVTSDLNGTIYVADTINNVVRKITGNTVSLFAGSTSQIDGANDGLGSAARFAEPSGLDFVNGKLYIADYANDNVRVATPAGAVTTLAGNGTLRGEYLDGPANVARFSSTNAVAVDAAGNVYVVDYDNYAIRKISAIDGTVTTTLSGKDLAFMQPAGIAISPSGELYVSAGNQILKVAASAM
ncbi:hypothetical protein HDU91_004159 [Kappamyces sp. JEL0680]|nr:hypothetical protein HDU91_004159 [Kappamyces sp. JEL0680]